MGQQDRSGAFIDASIPVAYERYLLPAIFAPWADDLIDRTGLRTGQAVLDVASGLGPVARRAAQAVGPTGRVVASDVSSAMLAFGAATPVSPEWPRIEYLECSATALAVKDGEFDAAICQQGLQFFPDRAAALAEMHRAIAPGGRVIVAAWAAEHPVGLFGPMADCLREAGLGEPFPGAFDTANAVIAADELAELLDGAGLVDITVATLALDAVWASADEVVNAVHGTPFGPRFKALAPADQARFRAMLMERLGTRPDGTVTVRTVSNVASGTRGPTDDR